MRWKTRLRTMLNKNSSKAIIVGSKVYIVDGGHCFPHYDQMAQMMNLTNWHNGCSISAYDHNSNPIQYIIITKAFKHPHSFHVLYGVESPITGQQYIMGQNGIKKV